jgi:membrane protease YdiL (CAAX protease family)
MAVLVEGGLAVVAGVLAWVAGVPVGEQFRWTLPAVSLGVLAALPMFALFLIAERAPVGSLRRIRKFLIESLGGPLASLRWYETILVAVLAGFGEELLFRGALQPWLERWGDGLALVLTNLAFGLCHAVTPLYLVLATLFGCYFSWLADGGFLPASGRNNLVAPIVAHALYDYLAFLVVAREWRRLVAQTSRSVQDE